MKRWWLGLWILLATYGAAGKELNERELMVDGAIRVAVQRLAQDRNDDGARLLLEFALVFDEANPQARALTEQLAQSDDPVPAQEIIVDKGVAYSDFLAGLAEHFAASEATLARGALIAGVALVVNPRQAKAREVQAAAGRRGLPANPRALLARYKQSEAAAGAVAKETPEAPPAKAAPAPARPAATASDKSWRQQLDAVVLPSAYLVPGHEMQTINLLNSYLDAAGIEIVPAAARLPYERVAEGLSGRKRYIPRAGAAARFDQGGYVRDLSAATLLRYLAAQSGTVLLAAGNKITLADPDPAAKTQPLPVKAEELAEGFRSSLREATTKYSNLPLEVLGELSGVSATGTQRRLVIALDNNRVRVQIGDSAEAREAADRLKSIADGMKEAGADAGSGRREWRRRVLVLAQARYQNCQGGRVSLENAEQIEWVALGY